MVAFYTYFSSMSAIPHFEVEKMVGGHIEIFVLALNRRLSQSLDFAALRNLVRPQTSPKSKTNVQVKSFCETKTCNMKYFTSGLT